MSEDSLEVCMPPKITDVRRNKVKSTLSSLGAPTSPTLGATANWDLAKNDLEQVLINFCIYSLSPVCSKIANPAKTSIGYAPDKH